MRETDDELRGEHARRTTKVSACCVETAQLCEDLVAAVAKRSLHYPEAPRTFAPMGCETGGPLPGSTAGGAVVVSDVGGGRGRKRDGSSGGNLFPTKIKSLLRNL